MLEEEKNELVESKEEEKKKKKFKINWVKILINILLLPFRIIELIFKLIYGSLNLALIAVVGCCFLAVFVGAKVYPMYQEAATQAYDKLAHLEDSDFHMLGNTVIYDSENNILGEIDAGNYKYVDITNVSDWVQYGYISTEDKRFREHIGIDAKSLARAAIALVKNDGEITQGGSTITQQVIKNNFLTQEKSYSRKLVEVLIAPKIEQRYSKDKIMEFYVNTNYYGNGCYGIEAASEFYFGKTAKKLSLAESAMLCGVSNSPNNYNPIASMDLAKKKMTQVLDNMKEQGFITEKQYKKALKKKIKVKAIVDEYDNDNYMISYALYCTALELMKNDGFEFKYVFDNSDDESKYNEKFKSSYSEKAALIRAGGFKIYTSFDQNLQIKLQKSIDSGLSAYKEKQDNGKYMLQGSAVCVDNSTGYVVAMVGGRGDKDEFNRGFLAKRQPGSSIKPLLVYAPAINEGVLVPSTVYVDKKVYAREGDTTSYSPKNSGGGYRGAMTVREALARSINTIAYQIYRDTGLETSIGYLNRMMFSTLSYADMSAQSLCLGGFTNGVRVVDLAKGYATLPMGGQYSNRTCLVHVEHETKGTLVDEVSLEESEHTVFNADTAFMMCDMMQGTIEEDYGTAKSIRNSKMIAAGKTGTTSSNKDAWFSGFTKDYTCTVWIGYDTPRVMAGMYGGTIPARIWSNFMTGIKSNLKFKDFEKPSSISLRKISGYEYTNEVIDIKHTKGDKWYDLREGGTEWYSNLNDYSIEIRKKQAEINLAYNNAKIYAEKFLDYYIYSIDEALRLDDEYSKVMGYLDSVGDDYKVSSLRSKVTSHYSKLKFEVLDDWKDYIDEYNKSEEELRLVQEKENVEDSKLQASVNLKNNRVSKADWYINELNSRNYNTEITQLLYEDAEKAVERLDGYDCYDDYLDKLAKAKDYIDSLPTEIIVEVPKVPEDSNDNVSIDEDDYIDNPPVVEIVQEVDEKDDEESDETSDDVVDESDNDDLVIDSNIDDSRKNVELNDSTDKIVR